MDQLPRVEKRSCCLPVIMWFLFGEVSSSSGCLRLATLLYRDTPLAFHIIILFRIHMIKVFNLTHHQHQGRSKLMDKGKTTMAEMVLFLIRYEFSKFEFCILDSEFRISKKGCVWKFCFWRCHIRVRARVVERDPKFEQFKQ